MDKKYGNNPIIRNKGVCDPHIHIFNNKAYLYASHDASPTQSIYTMFDWHIYSSSDLVNWELESVFKPEDTYIGKSSSCWATDAAEKNGKFYFYYSNATTDTGVAVSNHPGKGFIDPLNKPILPEGITKTRSYDPAVFIDDDEEKSAYIIFGTPVWANGDSYYIAKLNEDMISLAETPRKVIVNDEADDKPSLHKHNGTYYLSWASHYATSDNVYGPYTYVGNVGSANDHGNFFEWNNQWFQSFTIYDPTISYRATGLCYIHYKDNGEMVADQMIMEYGVGQYEASWNKIEAEWFMACENVSKKEHPHYGFTVHGRPDGYIYFPNIHDVPENASISFFATCVNPYGSIIEVREENASGKLLGECHIPYTNYSDWRGYRTFVCDLVNTAGDKNLCFVFKGQGEDLVHLDWFKFFKK